MSWTRIMATSKQDIVQAIKNRNQTTIKEIIQKQGHFEIRSDDLYFYIDPDKKMVGGKTKAINFKTTK